MRYANQRPRASCVVARGTEGGRTLASALVGVAGYLRGCRRLAFIPQAGRVTRARRCGSRDRIAFHRARILRLVIDSDKRQECANLGETWLTVVSSATFPSSSATSASSTPSSPTYANASITR